MYRREALVFSMVLLLILALSACGKKSTADTAVTDPTVDPEPTEVVEPEEEPYVEPVPSGRIVHNWKKPSILDTNTIRSPLGDQAGVSL